MDLEEKSEKIYKDLKGDYDGVERIEMENENIFQIYADDDTLWQIFEEMINQFSSIEFDAGSGEAHFLRIII